MEGEDGKRDINHLSPGQIYILNSWFPNHKGAISPHADKQSALLNQKVVLYKQNKALILGATNSGRESHTLKAESIKASIQYWILVVSEITSSKKKAK